jgi:TPR repeat protein
MRLGAALCVLLAAGAAEARRHVACGDPAACDAGCKRGNAGACGELAQMLLDGKLMKRDAVRANAALAKACAGGHGPSCEEAGKRLVYSDMAQASANRARGRDLLKKACAAGDPQSCLQVPDSRDTQATSDLLEKGCKQGFADDCEWADPERAIKLFVEGCAAGDLGACVRVEVHEGRQMSPLAREASKRLCDRGIPWGCHTYSYYLYDKDPTGSKKKMREKACADGLADSCQALARYDQPSLRACELGDLATCRNIARKDGDRTPVYALIERHCREGEQEMCYLQALLLEAGVGVAADKARAAQLLEQGCSSGQHDVACKPPRDHIACAKGEVHACDDEEQTWKGIDPARSQAARKKVCELRPQRCVRHNRPGGGPGSQPAPP